jgi:hypothetical protein
MKVFEIVNKTRNCNGVAIALGNLVGFGGWRRSTDRGVGTRVTYEFATFFAGGPDSARSVLAEGCSE